jgi:putative heme transporter
MTSSTEVDVSDPGAQPPVMPDPAAARRRPVTWVRVLQVVLGLGLAVGLLGWALPYFAHTTWGDVWAVLRGIPATTAFGLFLLMVLGLWLYTFTFTGSLPLLPHVKAFIVNVSGSAVGNLLPAGGAAGAAATYKQLRSWGFSRRSISTSLIVTGVWNIMGRLLLPIIGICLMIFFAADLNPAVMRAAALGAVGGIAVLAMFITMLASERACQTIGAWLERTLRFLPVVRNADPSLSHHILDQRHQTIAVVGHGWLSMTFGLVGFFGMNYLLFWFCQNTVGVQFPFPYMFFAFALSRLLTSVTVTPGGVGVSETGVAALLVGWGANPAQATAGVVLYSLYVHFLEVPLGALGWLAWWAGPKVDPAKTPAQRDAPGQSSSVTRGTNT